MAFHLNFRWSHECDDNDIFDDSDDFDDNYDGEDDDDENLAW